MEIFIDYEALSKKGDELIALAESLVEPKNSLNAQYLDVISTWKGQEIPTLKLSIENLINNIDTKINTLKQKGQLLKTYAAMYKTIEDSFVSDGGSRG